MLSNMISGEFILRCFEDQNELVSKQSLGNQSLKSHQKNILNLFQHWKWILRGVHIFLPNKLLCPLFAKVSLDLKRNRLCLFPALGKLSIKTQISSLVCFSFVFFPGVPLAHFHSFHLKKSRLSLLLLLLNWRNPSLWVKFSQLFRCSLFFHCEKELVSKTKFLKPILEKRIFKIFQEGEREFFIRNWWIREHMNSGRFPLNEKTSPWWLPNWVWNKISFSVVSSICLEAKKSLKLKITWIVNKLAFSHLLKSS